MTPAQKNRLEDLKGRFILHKGHLIQYISNAHRNNFGILDRITIDEDYVSLKLWLRQPPQDISYSIQAQAAIEGVEFFPIYIDQFACCFDCKRKEAKPKVASSGEGIDPSRLSVRSKSS